MFPIEVPPWQTSTDCNDSLNCKHTLPGWSNATRGNLAENFWPLKGEEGACYRWGRVPCTSSEEYGSEAHGLKGQRK